MPYRMVSLFTGAGGLDYGFEAAGFEPCVGLEIDSDCCATVSRNRQWPVINKDIHDTTSREILDTGYLRRDEIDLLVGGPPCQPFSKSGYWYSGDSGRLDDDRSNTPGAYMRCVSELLPTVFVLENVHGINYSGKEDGFVLLRQLTEEINRQNGTNYSLSWKVINTADFGVPQSRQRFVLVGHIGGRVFEFPPSTHFPPDDTENERGQNLYITAWDAIGRDDLTEPAEDLRVRGKWADLLPSIPEGENYLWHTRRKGGLSLFGWRTRYWNFLLKLAKNKVSWTIQAQPGPSVGPFHWENRLLSVKEMARLQTFPDDVIFSGKRGSVQKQIGNAFPSLASEVLGRAILTQIFDEQFVSGPTLAIEYDRPIPPPEPINAVPTKYFHLVGDHPDHD